MITTDCHFVMKGDTFSPKKAGTLLDIEFEIKNEPREIARRGRYKNQPCPFGYGLFRIGSMEKENYDLFLKKMAIGAIFLIRWGFRTSGSILMWRMRNNAIWNFQSNF
ncbi:MAG: hypothetical protein KAH24_07905 [Holophagae bacterium]|nr:hypothetical protein [Holophagae bacterium]